MENQGGRVHGVPPGRAALTRWGIESLSERRGEVLFKMPIGACSQFLLASDILKRLPAGSFLLRFLFKQSSLCVSGYFCQGGTLGRARCRGPSFTGGFGARLAFLAASFHDSRLTSACWFKEGLHMVSKVFSLCLRLFFPCFLRHTRV